MEKITFVINTTKKEIKYLDLLLKSLDRNLSTNAHEIVVFVDTGFNDEVNQVLEKWKPKFLDFSVIWNPLDIPIGYQRNINILVETAKHDIVSYLQSDMYISKDYDIEILKQLHPGVMITATRIEPPLHPASPDKFVKDFGLTPDEFREREFEEFCKSVYDDGKITNYYFAPFTFYKDDWISIGGHDTIFRRSSEDVDIFNRLVLNGMVLKQIWSAYVYHFTCVSSRGKDWWKAENKVKTMLQEKAQQIEMRRFIYKWGAYRPIGSSELLPLYKYNVSATIKNPLINGNLLYNILPFFHSIYVDNEDIKIQIITLIRNIEEPNGDVFIPGGMLTRIEWEAKYKKYVRTLNWNNIIQVGENTNEIIVEFDLSKLSNHYQVKCIQKINDSIHYSTEEDSEYEYEIFRIKVKSKINKIMDNVIVKNPPLDFKLKKEKIV